jgi:hypothetical protein
MIERIFPSRIDNAYRGLRAGLWVFGLVVLIRLAMGANTMINTRSIAEGADGIPLDSYGAAAAGAVVSMFALLGLSKLVIGLLGLIALIRYRAMIPLILLLMLAEHGAGRLLALARPIVRSESAAPGFSINMALLGLLLLALLLSLWRPARDREAA